MSQKRKGGQPNLFTPEIGKRVCELIAQGQSTTTVGAAIGVDPSTIRKWGIFEKYSSAQHVHDYARARLDGMDALAESALEIAADDSREAQSRRVHVDTIKWFASKINPARWGDKVAVTGADGGASKVEHDLSALGGTLSTEALRKLKEVAEEREQAMGKGE